MNRSNTKRKRSGANSPKHRVTASDYPIPKHISEGDLEIICRQHGFNCQERVQLAEFLNDLVKNVSEEMLNPAITTTPKEQVEKTTALLKQISKTRKILASLDKATAHTINKAIAYRIAPLLSAKGLASIFDDFAVPTRSRIQREPEERSIRSSGIRENGSITQHKYYFIRRKGAQAIEILLTRMDYAINELLTFDKESPDRKGGRHKLWQRRLLLINLLHIYGLLKRPVPKAQTGKHVDFCVTIFRAMQLRTEGIAEDIPRAIKELQNHLK